jgi:uncharacterized linocin/CFP29 family protein
MNGSPGRDRVWNDHIWSEIDKAVREEVGRVRVAQKVFPSTVVNNVSPVSTTRLVPFGLKEPPDPLAPGYDQFQPFFEISAKFVLSQAQVDGEENVHLGRSRARLAASVIANTEDAILFLGQGGIPKGVEVTNQTPPDIPAQFAVIPPGFVAEAANYTAIYVPDAGPDDLGNILAAVAEGIAALYARAQPGPYALFLPPSRYAQTFAPFKGLLKGPGDELKVIITGGFYMVNSLAHEIGILAALGGESARITLGTDATTAFTHTDEKGNYHFRVLERIQMVVQDGRAFQTLKFKWPPPKEEAPPQEGPRPKK